MRPAAAIDCGVGSMFRILVLCGLMFAAACTSVQERQKDVAAEIASGELVGEELAWKQVEHGRLLLASGDIAGAMADFDAAIATAPTMALAYGSRGDVWRLRGEVARAVADYDQAIVLSAADDPSGYLLRGDTFAGDKQYEKALADYDKALALEATYWPARVGRGIVLAELGEDERALEDLKWGMVQPWQWVFLFPRKSPYSMGAARGTRIEGYRVNATPVVAKGRFTRGKILLRHGAYEEALSEFDAALGRVAQFPGARLYRGLAMLGLGDCADGIAEIRAGGSMANVAFDSIVAEHRALIDKTPCAGEIS